VCSDVVVKNLVAVENRRIFPLQGAHDFLSRSYGAVEGFHLLIALVSCPCDVFDVLGYWFLVSVELTSIGQFVCV